MEVRGFGRGEDRGDRDLGGSFGGTAEAADLAPVAFKLITEDEQEVTRLGRLQRALDRLLPGGEVL